MLSTKSQLSHSQTLEGFLPATNLDRRTSMVFSTFDREAASLSHDQLFFRVPTRNLEAELYIPKEEISNQQMLVALK